MTNLKLKVNFALILMVSLSLVSFNEVDSDFNNSLNLPSGELSVINPSDHRYNAPFLSNNKEKNTANPKVPNFNQNHSWSESPTRNTAIWEYRDDEIVEGHLKEQTLLYYPNIGQHVDTDGNLIPEVEYVVKAPNMKVYIRKTGLSYVFERIEQSEESLIERRSWADGTMQLKDMEKTNEDKVSLHRIDINFIGATPSKRNVEMEPSDSPEHFYLSHCPDGLTVDGYKKVVMEELYTGIDLILYTKDRYLKYDWLVKAGADPSQIKMEIEGAKEYHIDNTGSLIIETTMGKITESAPEIFQDETRIQGTYKLLNQQVGFSIEDYNIQKDILIDPVREWGYLFWW